MDFLKKIISHFQKNDGLDEICTQDNIGDFQVEEYDKALKHYFTSQSSDTIPDVINTSYHHNETGTALDHSNDEIKPYDNENTEVAVPIINNEEALIDIDEFLKEVDGKEENIDETDLNIDNLSEYVDNTSSLENVMEEIVNEDEFTDFLDEIDTEEEIDFDLSIVAFKINRNTANVVERIETDKPVDLQDENKKSTTTIPNNEQFSKTDSTPIHFHDEDVGNTRVNLNDFNVIFENMIDSETKENKEKTNTMLDDVAPFESNNNKASHIEMEQNIATAIINNKEEQNTDVLTKNIQDNSENITDGHKENEIIQVQASTITNYFAEENTMIKTESKHTARLHSVIENENEIVIAVALDLDEIRSTDMNKSDSIIYISDEDDSNKALTAKDSNNNVNAICIDSDEEYGTKTVKMENNLNLDTFFLNPLNEDQDSDHCSGYHSSDFEFISEEEAKMDGLILNYTNKKLKTPDKKKKSYVYTEEIAEDRCNISGSSEESVNKDGKNKPGPSNSVFDNLNEPGPSNVNYERVRQVNNTIEYRNVMVNEEPNYAQNHGVPQGDEYLNMFQGIYAPAMASDLHFLENKSIRARSVMNIQYDGIGFDMRMPILEDSDDDECKEDAVKTAKKIASMYPIENRKRRRRF